MKRLKKPNIKINFDSQKVKDGGKALALTVLTIVGAVAKNSLENAAKVKINSKIYEKATYASVISAIINSDMWDSDKERAIDIIPKEADAELYGSILAIILGDMWSSSKLRTIENICKKSLIVADITDAK